jgi:ABC-type phosphate transport system auxiliary subunit
MSGDRVREMNHHLGQALKLIEAGSAANNAQIREEMKQFFAIAEEIERRIAKAEVSSVRKVKNTELMAIEHQRQQVDSFLQHFDRQISDIESRIRDVLSSTAPLLNC